jgi:RNA polymerase sigma-B factor
MSVLPSNETIFNTSLEVLLLQFAAAEDHSAIKADLREAVVAQTLPYVKRVAHGLARRQSDPVEDLIQVGTIGLLKAIEKYNPASGTAFKTFASYFITGEIRHYLRDKAGMIKAPRQMYELYYRMNQIIQQLSNQLGRTPTDVEIAEALACPVEKVQSAQAMDRRRTMVSLDQFLVHDGEASEPMHLEKLVDDNDWYSAERQEERIQLTQAMETLKPELRDVIEMRYFQDLSQMEIAQKLGISQMQVSRRIRKALDLLLAALEPDVRKRAEVQHRQQSVG